MPVTRSKAKREPKASPESSPDSDVSAATTASLPLQQPPAVVDQEAGPAVASATAVLIPSSDMPKRRRRSSRLASALTEESEASPRPKSKKSRLLLSAQSNTGRVDNQPPSAKAKDSDTTSSARYNLRATVARSQSAAKAAGTAIITPRSTLKGRQIDFNSASGGTSSTQPSTRVLGYNTGSREQSLLPPGVVDIYASNCQCHLNAAFCRLTNDSNLVNKHVETYGQEFTQAMQEGERSQYGEVFGAPAIGPYPFLNVASSNLLPSDQLGYGVGNGDEESISSSHLRYRPRRIPLLQAHSLDDAEHILPRQLHISAKMRSVLVNWMVEVANEYNVSETAFHLSVTILDAVLARGPTRQEFVHHLRTLSSYSQAVPTEDEDDYEDEDEKEQADESKLGIFHRHEFQALGWYVGTAVTGLLLVSISVVDDRRSHTHFFSHDSACIWIASKLEDENPPQISDLVYISDHSFSVEVLLGLEKRILKSLSFGVHRVTPMHFLQQFLRASQASVAESYASSCLCQDHPVMRQMTMYLLELSCISFDLSYRPPSLVTAAAVYLARSVLGLCNSHIGNGFWSPTLQHITGYSVKELQDTVLLLHKYHLMAATSSLTNAMYSKYRKYRNHLSVALKPSVRLDDFTADFYLHGATHEDMLFWETTESEETV